VLDRDQPRPPEKEHSPLPIFGRCLLWPNGWMNEDALGPGHIVLDGAQLLFPEKGHIIPNFRSMSVVASCYIYNSLYRCHLVWTLEVSLWRLALATLCWIGWEPSRPKGYSPPIFGRCMLWSNGWRDQDMALGRPSH